MAFPIAQAGAGALLGLGAGLEELIRRNTGKKTGGNFVTGYPGETQQFQRFTPNQQGLQNQSINQTLALLQGGTSPLAQSSFAPIEQKARSDFASKTIPSLAERFTALGNGQRSSAFQGALGEAGAGLEQGLAGLQSGHNLQLLQLLLGLGMQPSFESAYTPAQPGLLQAVAPAAGKAAALAFGAPSPLGEFSGYGDLFHLLSNLQASRNAQQYTGPQQQQIQSANRLGGA